MSKNTIELSIVVPFFYEEEVLPELHKRISTVVKKIGVCFEIVYVNDGSTDATLAMVKSWAVKEEAISIVDLSRNFGKEIALTAGIDHAKGNYVVVIDADLQDPPELISEMYDKMVTSDYEVIYGKRTKRDGETWVKKASAHLFYRLINAISETVIPEDTGDFRILSRRAVTALSKLREQHRFMKGLFAWIGFKQGELLYHRDARYAGETKWQYGKLFGLAVEGITSFSFFPLKLATYLGSIVALFSFMYGGYIIVDTVVFGNDVAGYPSLMVVTLFLGAVQLLAIGIMGSYVGRMFDESKHRPLYFVNEYIVKNDRK
jgi:glycosyltransferase involved in cell wall biosynthesis